MKSPIRPGSTESAIGFVESNGVYRIYVLRCGVAVALESKIPAPVCVIEVLNMDTALNGAYSETLLVWKERHSADLVTERRLVSL